MAQGSSTGRRGHGFLLLVMIALMAGCQTGPGTTESATGLKVPRSTGGTKGVGDAALLEGSVVDKDGCLAIRHDEPHTDHTTVAVFDVEDARPDTLRVGQHVSLGGGTISPQGSFDIPEECAGEEEYFLVVME